MSMRIAVKRPKARSQGLQELGFEQRRSKVVRVLGAWEFVIVVVGGDLACQIGWWGLDVVSGIGVAKGEGELVVVNLGDGDCGRAMGLLTGSL